jgi:RNA polymerase sigma-70 factor (ECF subfamily)
LYGIALRVAASHRRRLGRRRESAFDEGNLTTDAPCPATVLEKRQAAATVEHILNSMTVAKRAVFVMFELEGLSCEQIAVLQGAKLGTVYSRLHHARSHFVQELKNLQAQGKQR